MVYVWCFIPGKKWSKKERWSDWRDTPVKSRGHSVWETGDEML